MRFFADETDLLLAKRLESQHPGEVVYPGHPELPQVPRQSLDETWLPVAGSKGLVIVTRDKRIRSKPVERQLWIDHKLRGFVLTGRKSQDTKQSLEVLETNWNKIQQIIEQRPTGPWMYAVTSGGLREIQLDR